MKTAQSTVLGLAAFLAFSSLALAGNIVIADSTAGYSGVQGGNGWSYGYYSCQPVVDSCHDGKTFSTNFITYGDTLSNWWAIGSSGFGSYLFVGPDSQAHPGETGTNNKSLTFFDAVREYSSDFAGAVTISGTLAKIGSGAATQTIYGMIYKNGTVIYSQSLAGNDTTGYTYSISTTLNVGDKLDFAVSDPGLDINNALTHFSGLITAPGDEIAADLTPEPKAFQLVGGMLVLAFVSRKVGAGAKRA